MLANSVFSKLRCPGELLAEQLFYGAAKNFTNVGASHATDPIQASHLTSEMRKTEPLLVVPLSKEMCLTLEN